jgi:hypothetical protein
MEDALVIKRLYERRWRRMLALADFERRAAVHKSAIAEIEDELRKLVLFVPPLIRRKPNPHFTPGELSRLCRFVLRERCGAFLAIDQIATGVMRAKGLDIADLGLRKDICRMARGALRRVHGRGTVAKSGWGATARWGLPTPR